MITRPVEIAPFNTLCGFKNCGSGVNAIHVLTESFPVAPAGTALCGFHSPFDVTMADMDAQRELSPLRRWEVKFTPNGFATSDAYPIHTFTWGQTYAQAYARVTEFIDDNPRPWDGYDFEIASIPTL